jgi:thiosulfate/3-mercaptopyruvate sulfurtransferase
VAASQVLDADNQLLDAREAARFAGEIEPIDPVAGHIPGAQCATFTDNLANGRFRSPAELKARFEAMGVESGDPVVCYCGSGVTATHNILALLLAGYPEPALYPGSWSGWITDPSRPIATGS